MRYRSFISFEIVFSNLMQETGERGLYTLQGRVHCRVKNCFQYDYWFSTEIKVHFAVTEFNLIAVVELHLSGNGFSIYLWFAHALRIR